MTGARLSPSSCWLILSSDQPVPTPTHLSQPCQPDLEADVTTELCWLNTNSILGPHTPAEASLTRYDYGKLEIIKTRFNSNTLLRYLAEHLHL